MYNLVKNNKNFKILKSYINYYKIYFHNNFD